MTIFKSKYRVESIRMPHRNYAMPGMYFTICTKKREPSFGRVDHGIMRLSPLGQIRHYIRTNPKRWTRSMHGRDGVDDVYIP